MIDFWGHPAFRVLEGLALPREDFVIAGSGPLLARGIIDDVADVDVVARGAAWRRAAELGEVTPAPFGGVRHVVLGGGKVEVLDGWLPDLWSVDELIAGAEVVGGLRFVRLDVVVRTKESLRRPRDREHLDLLARADPV